MMEDRFPRIWVPDAANRDLRQLLWHRHRLVQMRTRVMNQLHVVALNEGLRRKKALWRPAGRNELESLNLAPWASRRLAYKSFGMSRVRPLRSVAVPHRDGFLAEKRSHIRIRRQ
jgi:transposase